MIPLSPHFSLAELTRTDTGLPNVPNQDEIARLRQLAEFLEKVRVILGNQPIAVHSAFRSAAVNAAVGGVSNSAHRLCYACDFVCPGYGSPYTVARALDHAAARGEIVFDQLIQEGTWVHISRDPRARGQRLTLVGPGEYANGIEATP